MIDYSKTLKRETLMTAIHNLRSQRLLTRPERADAIERAFDELSIAVMAADRVALGGYTIEGVNCPMVQAGLTNTMAENFRNLPFMGSAIDSHVGDITGLSPTGVYLLVD